MIDIDSEEAIQAMENRRAISQFMEVVPGILQKLGKQPIIAFGRPSGLDDDVDIPDFMLTDYGITFTAGGYISDKYATNPLFDIRPIESPDGIIIFLMINTLAGSTMIDVKLDYKTEEDWERTLEYVFKIFDSNYGNDGSVK